MASRATLATALSIAREGKPSRARMSKFGSPVAHFRQKMQRWEWAMRVLERRPCGAARRRDGKPCRALNVAGRRRCRWHGGLSTGPKSGEGRLRALANLKQYQSTDQPAKTRRRASRENPTQTQ